MMNHKKKKLLRSLQLLLEQVQGKRLQQKTFFRKRKKPAIRIIHQRKPKPNTCLYKKIKNKKLSKRQNVLNLEPIEMALAIAEPIEMVAKLSDVDEFEIILVTSTFPINKSTGLKDQVEKMKKKAEERLLIKQEGKCKGTKAIYKEIVQKKKEIEEEKNIGKESVKLLVE